MTVSLQGKNPNKTTRGTAHYYANQTQRQATNSGLLGSETVIAFKSLIAAGLSPLAAQCATLKARNYLTSIGAHAGSLTLKPQNRK